MRHISSKKSVCSSFTCMLHGRFWKHFSQDALGRKLRGLQPYRFTQCVLYLGILSRNCQQSVLLSLKQEELLSTLQSGIFLDILSQHWTWAQCPRHAYKKDCNCLSILHQLGERNKFYFHFHYRIMLLRFSLWGGDGKLFLFVSFL